MPRKVPLFFLALLSVLAGLVFTQSPGTTDVDIWTRWINNAAAHGLVQGYATNEADYPPLADAILYGAHQLFGPPGASAFESVKYSILIFLLLTALLFGLWTRDLGSTLILYFALFLNSVALGYIDIYFAPGMVLSLWMLKKRRWLLASLFFTLTCLTKWQPVIIAPFIVLYLLEGQIQRRASRSSTGVTPGSTVGPVSLRFGFSSYAALAHRLLLVLLPALALAALALLIFGVQPTWLAFRASLSHKYLSGNALNLNWVITHYLHVTRPAEFGGLLGGMSSYIETDAPEIITVPRLLFYLTYLASLLFFLWRKKTFANLLIFAITGFLCYYTFNTGVHENHLFLVAILAVVLIRECPNWRIPALILLLMNSINLFLFYGVNGSMDFSRIFLGVDMALVLALFYVLFFVYWYAAALTGGALLPNAERVGRNAHLHDPQPVNKENLKNDADEKYAQIDIRVPLRGNALLEKTLAVINEDVEVKTLWRVLNVNAIDRLGMTDHGPVHFQIVSNIALRLARLLVKHQVVMAITRDYALSNDYAELVVLLGSLFHDLGMSISREGHEGFSLFLANNLLHRLLDFLPVDERTIITSEVLHSIISHRSGGHPYTIEAGIVRVADALDMSEGRTRIPYQAGKIDIHSVSATAIDKVEILEGVDKPIQINIRMNNIAGIFQVDELLRQKLLGSGIEVYVIVSAFLHEGEEQRLIKEFAVP